MENSHPKFMLETQLVVAIVFVTINSLFNTCLGNSERRGSAALGMFN
jgi:hypothetical protein